MASPAKRRKLNSGGKSSKGTPARNLDYFFGNKKDEEPADNAKGNETASAKDKVALTLTDEQLARKLQDEWDLEAAGGFAGFCANGAASAFTGQHQKEQMEDGEDKDEHMEEDVYVADDLKSSKSTPQTAKDVPTGLSSMFGQKNTLALQSAASAEDSLTSTIPFDESPLTFDPSKYIPDLQKIWAAECGDASYALLTRCFVLVNSTQSRIKIVDTMVNLLRTIIEGDPSSLLPTVWLATNSISPPYISLELGLGGSAISKALKNVCGLDNRGLKALYNKHGDAGDVAFEAKKKQSFTLRKPKPLSIKGAYQSLVKIANIKGTGSAEQKQRIVDRLVQDARGAEESRYIVRTLCQHLRIGAVKTTMLIALSRAFLICRPPCAEFPILERSELIKLKKEQLAEVWAPAEEIVKACFARRPNYNDLCPSLLEVGVCDDLLIRCGLALHIPLRPMLGSITRDLSEMLTKLQGRDFSCEYKYDGQRAQVHCDEKGKVSIFSRHLELMTDKYPDLVALVPQIRGEGVGSFIMEGEVVAVDQQTGALKTFQTLTNRARKDVAIGSITVEVCLFAFDLMYLNGEPLLDRSFRERRELLRSLFTEVPNKFTWVKSIDATSQDSEMVLEFFKSATDLKCEGLMVKVLDNLTNPNLQVVNDVAFEPTPPPVPTKSARGKSKAKGKDGNEATKTKGVRRKELLATYEPDKRLDSWLKVKKDYSTTSDTIDMIPVAGWHGQGRKSKWWSPILLAVRNPATGGLEVVCKCISGFTDTFYKANRAFYDNGSGEDEEGGVEDDNDEDDSDEKDNEGKGAEDDGTHTSKTEKATPSGKDETTNRKNTLPHKPSYIEYSAGHPDVWFQPQEVWEIAFADITISPAYTAAIGLVHEDKGLSLRFPRFLRKREDKGIEEASTVGFLAGLYRKQMERVEVEDEGGSAKDVEGEDSGDGEEEEE